MSQTSSMPIYMIDVGTPGTFTSAATTDMAPLINSEIAAAPAGSQIELKFEPGNYGLASPVFLPSNTSVIGNGSTLISIGLNNQGLLVNKDAYTAGPWLELNLTNGTGYGLWSYSTNNTSGTSTEPPSLNAIIDNNISVQGMTFISSNGWTFGTWFTNSQNIDIQNNTYIGGVDGNAFVNVVNGVVSSNIAIGQTNGAYDNWDGPVNISIQDNSAFMNNGWSVLINSTPTGDPSNPGNAVNDNITGNNFSTATQNNLVLNTNALLSYGFSYEQGITEQGNVISLNGVPGNTAVYAGDPMYNMTVQNNNISGTNVVGQSFSGAVYVVDSGKNATMNPTIDGNLITGSSASPGVSSLVVMGTAVSAIDNAILGANLPSVATVSTDLVAGNLVDVGNVVSSGTAVSGSPVLPSLLLEAIPTLFVKPNSLNAVTGLEVLSNDPSDIVAITITSFFGALSDFDNSNASSIVLSGSLIEVNNELQTIIYKGNSQGWDDSIEIQASDLSGSSATRYIPVLAEEGTLQPASLVTLSANEFSSFATLTYPGALTGSAIVASTGNSNIDMTGSVSVVMLGSGENTVLGGSENGYISGGSGYGTLDLTGGGDITVAGGAGGLDVNALLGNNVIQPAAGGGFINLGSGVNSVYGGLGQFSVNGGTGDVYIASLPQNSGNFDASLGSGNATIFALSGNDSVETQDQTNNLIFLGLGNSTVTSSGNDTINTGFGSATVNAAAGGNDKIFGGVGSLYFIGGSGTTVIDPAGSTTVVAGTGSLTILPGQNITVLLMDGQGGNGGSVNLSGTNALICLSSFSSNPIASEYVSNGNIFVGLLDGTQITMPDINNQDAIFAGGFLTLGTPGVLANKAVYNLDGLLGSGLAIQSPAEQISSLLQSTPTGDNVILNSSGIQNNGIIKF